MLLLLLLLRCGNSLPGVPSHFRACSYDIRQSWMRQDNRLQICSDVHHVQACSRPQLRCINTSRARATGKGAYIARARAWRIAWLLQCRLALVGPARCSPALATTLALAVAACTGTSLT